MISARGMKIILLAFVVMIIGAVEANPLLVHMRDSKPERNDLQSASDSKDKPLFTEHYDQRQNGSENFRLKVDGLVFIMAPAETLLLAGAALEPNFTTLLTDGNDKPMPKPEKEDSTDKPKPDAQKILSFKANNQDSAHESHKPGIRISHLLAPFLNRFRHAQQTAHRK